MVKKSMFFDRPLLRKVAEFLKYLHSRALLPSLLASCHLSRCDSVTLAENNALCCFFDTLVPLRYLREEG